MALAAPATLRQTPRVRAGRLAALLGLRRAVQVPQVLVAVLAQLGPRLMGSKRP